MGRTVPGQTHLRNRNRITNKSRLRVVLGNYESDLVVPDEEDDKARIQQQTAGVDAEDANEHHLQAVLSAATQRNISRNKSEKDKQQPPAAYIPTPEARGEADGWKELYPTSIWKDPVSFVCSTTTADEAIKDGFGEDFTYYMDERDKEWLDRNNEEARGEGTSVQGALSSPTGSRSSKAAGSKAKGKDPEALQPVVVSEDDFELVMSIFEKVTYEKTEFLHHSLQTGMTFPEFSVYADTFSNELSHTFFSNFMRPEWIPKPNVLLRIAQLIYPHWKERREERQGHRIIPMLNFDESDTLNESYICFRRREVKSVRKTRASQVSSSEKLARLQGEMQYALRLSQLLIDREKFKKENAHQAQQVSHARLALVEMKCKFPGAMNDISDVELLVEKERVIKKSEAMRGLKIKASRDDSIAPGPREIAEKPKDRHERIRLKVDAAVQKHRDANTMWEDHENIYQPKPAAPGSKAFRYYEPPLTTSDDKPTSRPVAARCRRGRGGRFFIDRRPVGARPILDTQRRSKLFDIEVTTSEDMAVDYPLNREREDDSLQRTISRMKFDEDDGPAVPFGGVDEQERVLVDEWSPKYLQHSLGLIGEQDWKQLETDPKLYTIGPDGKQSSYTPYQLFGNKQQNHAMLSRPTGSPATMRISSYQQQVHISQSSQAANGTNGATSPMQIKKSVGPTGTGMTVQVPQMRISSNGGMARPISALAQQGAAAAGATPIPATNGHVNGVVHAPMGNGMPQANPAVNGSDVHDVTQPVQPNGANPSDSPPRPLLPSYRVASPSGWPNAFLPPGSEITKLVTTQQHNPSNPLTLEQQNKLRAAFNASQQQQAALAQAQYIQAMGGSPNAMKLQLPQQRQLQQAQWTASQVTQQPRPPSVNGRMVPGSPVISHTGSPPLPPNAPAMQQPQAAASAQAGY